MAADSASDIRDLEDLRTLIGEPKPTAPHKFSKALTGTQADFVKQSPFCLLGTADAHGVPTISPKGDAPGFVQVLAPDLLAIPERPGNKLIMSLKNILECPSVHLLFLIPNTCETLRINGRASLSKDPQLCKRCATGGQDALLVTLVQVTECFYHCAKAFVRGQIWNSETWPPARFKIQLGAQLARSMGEDAHWASEYETGYDGRVGEVAAQYTQQVWSSFQRGKPCLQATSQPDQLSRVARAFAEMPPLTAAALGMVAGMLAMVFLAPRRVQR